MKNKLITITSEFIMFLLTLGLVLLVYPPLPLYMVLGITLFIYVFSAILGYLLVKSIKLLMNKYREWKKSKHE